MLEKQIEALVNKILKDPQNRDLSYGLKARLIAKAVNNLVKSEKKK